MSDDNITKLILLDEVLEFSIIIDEYKKFKEIIDKDFKFIESKIYYGREKPIEVGTFRRKNAIYKMSSKGWIVDL